MRQFFFHAIARQVADFVPFVGYLHAHVIRCVVLFIGLIFCFVAPCSAWAAESTIHTGDEHTFDAAINNGAGLKQLYVTNSISFTNNHNSMVAPGITGLNFNFVQNRVLRGVVTEGYNFDAAGNLGRENSNGRLLTANSALTISSPRAYTLTIQNFGIKRDTGPLAQGSGGGYIHSCSPYV